MPRSSGRISFRWVGKSSKSSLFFVMTVLLSGSNNSFAVRLELDRVSSGESERKKETQLVRYIQCLKTYLHAVYDKAEGRFTYGLCLWYQGWVSPCTATTMWYVI
jgi:hypothetical protein